MQYDYFIMHSLARVPNQYIMSISNITLCKGRLILEIVNGAVSMQPKTCNEFDRIQYLWLPVPCFKCQGILHDIHPWDVDGSVGLVLLRSCSLCDCAGNTKDVEVAVKSEKEEEEEASNPPKTIPPNSMFIFKPNNP